MCVFVELLLVGASFCPSPHDLYNAWLLGTSTTLRHPERPVAYKTLCAVFYVEVESAAVSVVVSSGRPSS